MFHGSIVALVTPFHVDDVIDWDSLSQLIEFHIEQGTRAIVVIGTTGEAATLSLEEKQKIIRHAVEQSANRLPIIAGTGANSTTDAIKLTQIAMDEGVDACLLMTPAYIKPTQEGLYLHYKMIAGAVAIPQILYNIPSRTACDMLAETVARLADFPNIVGIKEGTSQVERTREILALCGDKLDVFAGDDPSAMDVMLAGAKGTVSVTANAAPRLMQEMCDAAITKNEALAKELNDKLMGLHKAVGLETNPIPIKWMLHEMGLIPAGIRLPLTPLSSTYHSAVRRAMQQAGIN